MSKEEEKKEVEEELFKVIKGFRDDHPDREMAYKIMKSHIERAEPESRLEVRAVGMDIVNSIHHDESHFPPVDFRDAIMALNYAVMAYQFENDLVDKDGFFETGLLVPIEEPKKSKQ